MTVVGVAWYGRAEREKVPAGTLWRDLAEGLRATRSEVFASEGLGLLPFRRHGRIRSILVLIMGAVRCREGWRAECAEKEGRTSTINASFRWRELGPWRRFFFID